MNDELQIEMRLWNYIDGNVNDNERKEIETLLQRDEEWKKTYKELISMHQLVKNDLELEEPSMRFTKNVMEEIDRLKIAPATKTYVNKKIVNAIAIFFLGLIGVIIVYAVTQIDFTNTTIGNYTAIDLSRFDLSKYFTPAILNILLALYVIMGLVLVDKIIARRKMIAK